ncbi:MAG: Serine-protein kinase RsbW [Chlamydiia bacterium]|nr:Serine-protein kinase RsbW [Chlamydiia bacterium]
MSEQIVFDAKLENLPAMLGWVRERLCAAVVSSSERNKFEVASEEILVNIINYAYEEGHGQLEMIWESSKKDIALTVVDFGTPFNPLEGEKRVIESLSLEFKEEGGLGIFLVKKLVDKIEYKYVDGANRFTISKRI